MTERVLLREFKEHIKGYGLTSDLKNGTYFGLTQGEVAQYKRVTLEFVEDPSLEKYKVGEMVPNLHQIPYIEIPRGTLSIYGEIRETLVLNYEGDYQKMLDAIDVVEQVNTFLEKMGVQFVQSDESCEKSHKDRSDKIFYELQNINVVLDDEAGEDEE